MGLSNYIPSSRIAQSGVCTSSTRPATPYEGQMIYETDTNRVLVYDNTAWVMIADTDAPPALQLVKSQAVGTTVTEQEVTSVFSSDFDVYKIIWSGGTSSAGTNIRVQMGSTNTGYYSSVSYGNYGSNTANNVTESNQSNWNWVGHASSSRVLCDFTLQNPFLEKWTSFSGLFDNDTSVGPSQGMLRNTTSYTSFKLIRDGSATFTGGTIYVYGYRK